MSVESKINNVQLSDVVEFSVDGVSGIELRGSNCRPGNCGQNCNHCGPSNCNCQSCSNCRK